MLRIASLVVTLGSAALLAAAFAPSAASTIAPAPVAAALELEAHTYRLDPVHSSIVYRIKHNSVAYFYGRFNEMGGTITWDESNPANNAINIQIKAESVDSGNTRRDGHLRNADFFNVTEHPTISFVTTKIERKGESGNMYLATGNLTLHGVTKSITADVEFTGSTTTGRGAHLMGLEAIFTIKRSEFNMNYGIEQGALGDEVRIMVGLEAVRS